MTKLYGNLGTILYQKNVSEKAIVKTFSGYDFNPKMIKKHEMHVN